MNNSDLEKKLERVKVPEVELLGHKQKLRAFLLENYARKEVFSPFKRAVPLGFAFIILLTLILRAPVFQRLDVALAKEIALRDSNFKSLIEQGGIIEETQVLGSKGYMLVRLGKTLITFIALSIGQWRNLTAAKILRLLAAATAIASPPPLRSLRLAEPLHV